MERRISDKTINTTAIRYFREVVRAGSFRKAAERINVAASAINRHVRLLEEDLDARLFERGRGRGGIKLTAAGEVLVRRVTYALNELATARYEIDALKGLQRGRVTVGVTDALAKELIPRTIRRFQEENARVDFHVRVGNTPGLVDALLEDRIDILIAYDVPQQIGIAFDIQHELRSCIVVPLGHPLAGRKSVSLAECASYPLALSDEENYRRAMLTRMFEEAGVKPSPVLMTNSFELMRNVVEEGLAISIQTHLPPARGAGPSKLVYIPLRDSLARFSRLACCHRTGRNLTSINKLFVTRLGEALAERVGPVAIAPEAAGSNGPA